MTLGAETTTAEVLQGVDLSGTTAVVTGASAGLGAETTRSLASVGAQVVMAVRDADKGNAAIEAIRAEIPDARLELGILDLASLESVRKFGQDTLANHGRINLLINNAGVMACPLGRTTDGFEMQLGTNHLGHFLLTGILAPALVNGAPARVVNLSSRGHLRGDIDWDDPHFRSRPYDKWEAYGQSKTANILFTVELDRRLAASGVRAYAVHPGVIITELGRHLTADDFTTMQSSGPKGGMKFKPVEAGAATTVWAATSPDLDGTGGVYIEDCHVGAPATAPDAPDGYAPRAVDPDTARRLWAWSEEEVGETFDLGR
jgi:NAD(P)-dependent dehydrogenase (short-subunit alcohol dehydrogenase family)